MNEILTAAGFTDIEMRKDGKFDATHDTTRYIGLYLSTNPFVKDGLTCDSNTSMSVTFNFGALKK